MDAGTGYRRYAPQQIEQARLICGLRAVDLPIDEIRVVLGRPATNQQWRLLPNRDGSLRLSCVRSGKVLDSPGGSGQGAVLIQWADNGGTNQWWNLVPAATSGYYRLVAGMADHRGMRSTVDPHLYPISVPRSRVSVLSDGEGIPPPGLGGQFAVSTSMIECAIIGYLLTGPTTAARPGWVEVVGGSLSLAAVHGTRV